jgi:GNAT superfamily N-acetyltransferase
MRFYDLLRQNLPQYDVIPLSEENYADMREVFDTNREFLTEAYGKSIDEKGILGAILQLPDNFDPANKYLAAICENGKAIAAVDLLANSPVKDRLYLSFLVVHRDLQSKGIGSSIIEGIIAAARPAGFTQINLGSFDNTAEFWRKQGFVQAGRGDDFIAFLRSIHERTN